MKTKHNMIGNLARAVLLAIAVGGAALLAHALTTNHLQRAGAAVGTGLQRVF